MIMQDADDMPVINIITETKCTECGGEGYFEYIKNYGSMNYYTTSKGDPWGPEYVEEMCQTCNGSGKQSCMGCGEEFEEVAYDIDDELWCSTECYNNLKGKHKHHLNK